jgi:hypothetical protein
MKNFTILLLLLGFISTVSTAQINVQSSFSKKFTVEFRVGPSFPYSDFGNKDAANQNSGFAKLGYKTEAIVGYKLIDVIGINLMGFYNANGTDLSSLTNQLNGLTPGKTWTSDSKSWNIYGGLLGFEYSYPASKSFIVGFKAYTGILNTTAPKVELTSGSDSYVQDEKSTTALTYMFSVSGAYPISKSTFWVTSVGYLSSTPKFDNVKTTQTINGLKTESTSTFNQDMKVFVVDTGIRIVF